RENDPSAGKLAEEAWLANSHVPGVLSGKQPLVASIDGYITLGARMRQLTTSRETARPGRPRPVQSRGWRRLPES
ncbi:hypothetical protein, partial [Mesorhizobium sp. M4B.F.Ca.ET.143.01.1.1]|uniref:hypothetical protein n=1 Tax=Mesorhizobium sp. M4B.F.Ca.ET.143.01.1.1 TaxID=2563947 RepID=UPI001AED6068